MTGVWGRLISVVMWYFTRVDELDLVKFMLPSSILKKAMRRLNLLSEVCRSARLKCQPIHDNDDHYQKSFYKHKEFS